jgi:hypothetical protein
MVGAAGKTITTLKPWQLYEVHNICASMNGDFLWRWQRGFSKTLMVSIIALFFACLGLRTCIILPAKKQLGQIKEYFETCELLDYRGQDKKIGPEGWYSINGKKLIHVDIAGMTAVNSGRFHCVIWDECAQLVKEPRKEYYYDKADGMFRAMEYKIKLSTSTPLIGSRFEKEDLYLQGLWAEKIKAKLPQTKHWDVSQIIARYQCPWVSWRNYENTPDNFVTDTPMKYAALMAERAKAVKMGLLWIWQSENKAIYVSAGGKVFTTVIFMKHNMTKWNISGFDFHEHEIGHIECRFFWNRNDPTALYATGELQHKYGDQDTAMESVKFLRQPAYNHVRKRGEDQGFNRGFFKDARRYGVIAANRILSKADQVANLFEFKIFVDPEVTPNLYEDIRSAQWKDPNKYEIRKESQGQDFRNHYLDCLLNAAPNAKGSNFLNTDQYDNEEEVNSPYIQELIRRQKRRSSLVK